MNLKKIVPFTLLVVLLFGGANVLADDYAITTLEGEVKVLGKGGLTTLYYFRAENNKRYILSGKLVEEIRKIKQFKLVLTGKVEEKSLTPWAYDVAFNKNIEVAEEAVIIGKLFYNKKKSYLVTKDQYVIRVYGDLLEHFDGRKMLLKGKYVKTGKYTGDIDVLNMIDLSK